MSAQRQQRGPSWLDDYVSVEARLAAFRAAHPKARILTQLLERETVTFRAEIYLEDNDTSIPNAVGHADVKGGSGNRSQSPIEKTETAAIGRALTVMGVEGGSDVTGRDEAQPAERSAPDKLTRDISEALSILNKSETDLDKWLANKFGGETPWRERSVEQRQSALAMLKVKIDKAVAETK